MKKLKNAILVSTLSILAACSNSGNPFGGNSNDKFFGNNMGDVSNPTSPAYFQQATEYFLRSINPASVQRAWIF